MYVGPTIGSSSIPDRFSYLSGAFDAVIAVLCYLYDQLVPSWNYITVGAPICIVFTVRRYRMHALCHTVPNDMKLNASLIILFNSNIFILKLRYFYWYQNRLMTWYHHWSTSIFILCNSVGKSLFFICFLPLPTFVTSSQFIFVENVADNKVREVKGTFVLITFPFSIQQVYAHD